MDIIVVQQPDGSFKSSPWYVRFGKFQGVLKARERVVTICVNGVEAGFPMYLDHKGEAYFVKECELEEGGDSEASSPSSGDEMNENDRSARFKKFQSFNYDGSQVEALTPLANGNGKIVSRTSSRRSRIFGLMFGSKSMKEKDQVECVERASSLERAEIAANLLETNWSTNLPPTGRRTDNPMEKNDFDPMDKSDFVGSTADKEMVSSNEEGTGDNFGTNIVNEEHFKAVEVHNSSIACTDYMGEDPNNCLSCDASVRESVITSDGKLDDNFPSNVIREVRFEERITQTSSSRTHEEVLEVYTLENGDLGNRSKLLSESATVGSDGHNVSSTSSANGGQTLGSETDEMTMASPEGKYDGEKEMDESQSCGSVASPEEKHDGEKEVSSLSCTEILQNSAVSFDVSVEAADTSKLLSQAVESLDEHTCEVTLRQESEKAANTEIHGNCHSQDLDIFRAERFQAQSSRNTAFQDIVRNDTTFQDVLRNDLDVNFPNSRFPGSEVICQERETIEHSQGEARRTEALDTNENQCLVTEDTSTPNCHVPVPNDICTILKERQESKSLRNGSGGKDSFCQNRLEIAQDESRFHQTDSLEEEQFQFSDIDSFCVKQINPDVQVSNTAMETDENLLVSMEGDIAGHVSEDTNQEDCFDTVSEVSGSQTSPVAIPRSTKLGETAQLAKSLPIIRAHIESSNLLHPLSCSLDLNSDSYKQDSQNKENSSCGKLESDCENGMRQEDYTPLAAAKTVDSESKEVHNVIPIASAAEISLCRHLLFEGMGADAASRVFETNKVNLEKFSSLVSSLMKNDKLVVRIGGRYFPWDAAAPIILGMVCFGQELMFEAQGMIAVDQDEKNDNPSGAIVPSGGSWRLWPFSLRKSRTMNSTRSLPDSTTQEAVNVAPPRSQSLRGHDDIRRAKFAKKEVRSLTPTSEELASLNLKEGRNVVTFSFSTAMLGQQQVDARIYLWKWNTHIVISDVDGTITKSDVLGQFMPLVGKDWSQTGVAHLFSAIKENGYQLLFLSARAISQAYLTRQFLLNLKQDGKTLPDGPVVISPDGLFPSLYREVIRRAPHEFKISCLEDIRALFPPDCNPFYAGFGNRDTDEFSYRKVGVPKGKIFIINPKGEVVVNHRVDTKSYTSLHALVNGMFPPVSTVEQEDFNSWNFWKLPLADVDI